jgi:hypothetical protein
VEELRITNSLRDQLCELIRCLMLTELRPDHFRAPMSQKLGSVTHDGEPA